MQPPDVSQVIHEWEKVAAAVVREGGEDDGLKTQMLRLVQAGSPSPRTLTLMWFISVPTRTPRPCPHSHSHVCPRPTTTPTTTLALAPTLLPIALTCCCGPAAGAQAAGPKRLEQLHASKDKGTTFEHLLQVRAHPHPSPSPSPSPSPHLL